MQYEVAPLCYPIGNIYGNVASVVCSAFSHSSGSRSRHRLSGGIRGHKKDNHVKRDALVDKNINVAADDENVQPLLKFFESKFRWLSGEYELTLKVQVEPERASLCRGYRMTLFESDSKELTDYRDDYKYGFGVCLDLQRHVGVIVPLTEA